jgi:putative adenylate-forming enzyme
MFEVRHAVLAYWRARRIRTCAQLTARADADLREWLRRDVPQVPFYAGRKITELSDLPIIDKATLMADFAAFNTAGITADMGWHAFTGSKQIDDLIVGASTGTSGNRGLFVISQAERFRWLGTILAKALPGFWRNRHRVAVLLPLNTPLYDSANRMQRLKLRFFDIGRPWEDDLVTFQPTVIIAPPKALRLMAELEMPRVPDHIFAGAEMLDPNDATLIAAYFKRPVRQIYMATEGLFAVSCERGTLHLCEDTMHFELPQVGDDPDLRAVIISDFSRSTQIMARYRMNDLIRLGPACDCGLPHQTVAEVVGRVDDCFTFAGGMITPDILRNAVVDADRQITDFRIIQTGAAEITVLVPHGIDCDVVGLAVTQALSARSVIAQVLVQNADLKPDMSRKLRRVENRWRGREPTADTDRR